MVEWNSGMTCFTINERVGGGWGWEGAKHVSHDTFQKCGGTPTARRPLPPNQHHRETKPIYTVVVVVGGGGGEEVLPVCMNPCVRAYPYGGGGKRSSLYESLCQSLSIWWWWWWWWWGGGRGGPTCMNPCVRAYP